MSAEDILSNVQLSDLNHRDAQFVRAELIEAIDAAISAAVQAEREACAKVCDARIERIKGDNMFPAYGLDGSVLYETERIAAAIRARGNGSK